MTVRQLIASLQELVRNVPAIADVQVRAGAPFDVRAPIDRVEVEQDEISKRVTVRIHPC